MDKDKETKIDFMSVLMSDTSPGSPPMSVFWNDENLAETARLLFNMYKKVVFMYSCSSTLCSYRDFSRSFSWKWARFRERVECDITMLSFISFAISKGFPLEIINSDGKRNFITTPVIHNTNRYAIGNEAYTKEYNLNYDEFIMGLRTGIPIMTSLSDKFQNNMLSEYERALSFIPECEKAENSESKEDI